MVFKNKMILIVVVLLLVIGGGFMVTSKLNEVFGESKDKVIIDDPSFSNIELSTNNTAVEFVSTNKAEATVEYTGETNKNSKITFKADVKGDTLYVQFKEKRKFFFSFDFNFNELKIIVSLPEKQYKRIKAESDNGRMSVKDIEAENILVETNNGQILIGNVKSDTIEANTNNGKIIFEHVEGEIKGTSDNGKISLTTKHLNQPIDLSTDNGGIEIITESEPTNAKIEAKTDNGKITIFGVEDTFASYGKGKHLIKLRTDNGRITVTK